MSPQFRVTLTKEEVEELQKISSTGSRSAKIVLFARALLLLDKGPHTTEHWTVNQTSKAVGLSERTLNHLKKIQFLKVWIPSSAQNLREKVKDP